MEKKKLNPKFDSGPSRDLFFSERQSTRLHRKQEFFFSYFRLSHLASSCFLIVCQCWTHQWGQRKMLLQMLLNWSFTLSQPNRLLSLPLDPVSPKDSRSCRKSSSSQQSIGLTTSTGIAIAAFSVFIIATKNMLGPSSKHLQICLLTYGWTLLHL